MGYIIDDDHSFIYYPESPVYSARLFCCSLIVFILLIVLEQQIMISKNSIEPSLIENYLETIPEQYIMIRYIFSCKFH